MSAYTNLATEDVRKIMYKYMDSDINSFKVLSGGSENSNYHIKTKEGEYVLTICENKSLIEAQNLANLLSHLNNSGFVTSEMVTTRDGNLTSNWASKPILLKRFIPGKIIQDLQLHMIRKIGQQIAKLHLVPASETVPKKFGYGIEHFDELTELGFDNAFTEWLQKTKLYIQSNVQEVLPKALIHGDIFFSNVIISSDEETATIMDFEEATNYFRVFDIGMAIVGLCTKQGSIVGEKVKKLVEGYQSVAELKALEITKLQCFTIYAASATAFWRFKQFNYTVKDKKSKDSYLEMQLIAENAKKHPVFNQIR